jgi:hypothetical protein
MVFLDQKYVVTIGDGDLRNTTISTPFVALLPPEVDARLPFPLPMVASTVRAYMIHHDVYGCIDEVEDGNANDHGRRDPPHGIRHIS